MRYLSILVSLALTLPAGCDDDRSCDQGEDECRENAPLSCEQASLVLALRLSTAVASPTSCSAHSDCELRNVLLECENAARLSACPFPLNRSDSERYAEALERIRKNICATV